MNSGGFGPEQVAVVPASWEPEIREWPGFWPAEKYKSKGCPVQRLPYKSELGYVGGVFVFVGEWPMQYGLDPV